MLCEQYSRDIGVLPRSTPCCSFYVSWYILSVQDVGIACYDFGQVIEYERLLCKLVYHFPLTYLFTGIRSLIIKYLTLATEKRAGFTATYDVRP